MKGRMILIGLLSVALFVLFFAASMATPKDNEFRLR